MSANTAIRWMLSHNAGQYPQLIKTQRGVILRKQYDPTGVPEYIGVSRSGHWMTATRVASLIANGEVTPLNAVEVEVAS